MKSRYVAALKEAMNQPALPNSQLTRTQLESAIRSISDELRGPMSNQERLLLCADRAELRATLESLDAKL